MPGRRSLIGVGKISLIYTMGREDPHPEPAPSFSTQEPEPVLTASVGEDFADCQWPVTLKAKAQVRPDELQLFVEQLTRAVARGFYMAPGQGPAVYWRWTGDVPPGLTDAEPEEEAKKRPSSEHTIGTGRRSRRDEAEKIAIYLMDDANNWRRDDFYGRMEGDTAISGTVDEDFAESSWPIVVKVHPEVSREQLARYLDDLKKAVEQGFFFEVSKENAAA